MKVGASSALDVTAGETGRFGGDLPRPVRVYECSGHPQALQTALEIITPGGHVRLIGASPKPVSFTAMDALAKEVTMSANFIYVDEFDVGIGLLADGSIDVRTLTTSILTMELHRQAWAALRQPDRAIKVLLRA
jgi:threonine dehydrogenase-like Zn-dependent dehydrogenase